MKKNVGSQLALYPMPTTIIGAMNDDKPTWTLVAHVGIIGHDHALVSLAANHFINTCIKKTKKISINMVTENFLPTADYTGSVSGVNEDKSSLFSYTIGDSGWVPMIDASPVTLECSVEDIYETPGFDSFICTIDNTYVDEDCLTPKGKVDYRKVKPVLFEFPTYEYLKTGDVIGKCLSFRSPDPA